MMKFEDLENAIGDNHISLGEVSASALANIMPFANVELLMDDQSFSYYYEIDVKELLESEMPNDELETLKNQGWAFNDNKDKIILYISN